MVPFSRGDDNLIRALFLTCGEQSLLAVKNRDLDEIRKEVGRRSEERGDIPRA